MQCGSTTAALVQLAEGHHRCSSGWPSVSAPRQLHLLAVHYAWLSSCPAQDPAADPKSHPLFLSSHSKSCTFLRLLSPGSGLVSYISVNFKYL